MFTYFIIKISLVYNCCIVCNGYTGQWLYWTLIIQLDNNIMLLEYYNVSIPPRLYWIYKVGTKSYKMFCMRIISRGQKSKYQTDCFIFT